jgi:NADH-quinone oxidoreductase subunit M
MSYLTILSALPLIGGIGVFLSPKRIAKQFAVGIATLEALISFWMAFKFQSSHPGYQFTESHKWVNFVNIHYAVGVDGLSLILILMTTILTPIVLLASWNEGEGGRFKPETFFFLILTLEAFGVAIFSATDIFYFYVLFEAMLIPVYFLIAGFGSGERAAAATKFLLYGLFGGMVMLVALIGLFYQGLRQGIASFDVTQLSQLQLPSTAQNLIFLGFFFAFAVKAPLWPFHTWLPSVTRSATPGTSIMLLGILDKVGTYGAIRFCLQLFPHAAHTFAFSISIFAVISIIYGALAAIAQRELPVLIGWTSISHFGFIILGIFAFTSQGMTGASFYMFNHAFTTAGLFILGGYLAKRRGSNRISDFGGVQRVTPVLAWLFFIAGLSGLALPGLSSFVSEFLVLIGTFTRYPILAIIATTAIILAALYILLMIQRAIHGETNPALEGMNDLSTLEKITIAPVIAAIIFFGFYPKPIINTLTPTTNSVLSHVTTGDPAPKAGN